MSTNELPTETDLSDAVNMESEPTPRTNVPTSSNAIFLWQYEFEQSLMNQQLQYQQQAKAMEASIKAAALQAAAGAAEVGKLLSQENDASMVDVVKELTSSSRRSIPTSPTKLEEKGNEKGSCRSRGRETSEIRSSRSKERRRKHRSRSNSWSTERRRQHRSRSRSMETKRYRSRSRSKERRSDKSLSRSRSKLRDEDRRSQRSRSRSRKKLQESCRSIEGWRRASHNSRSPPKGSNRDEFSFSRSLRSPSSPRRSKQDMKMKSKQRNCKIFGSWANL